MSVSVEQLQVEFRPSLEFEGEQFFVDAQTVVLATPSGWLGGSRYDIHYGANEEVAPRVVVQDGTGSGMPPFRGLFRYEDGKMVDLFPTKMVDVAVFDKASSTREYSRLVHDHIGPVRFPFFETRVKRALHKAENRIGKLATASA